MIRNLFALTLAAAATTGLISLPLVNAQSPYGETTTPGGSSQGGSTSTPRGSSQGSSGQEASESPDIVTILEETGQFNTLATALEPADLVEVSESEGPFTVFAPTDEAFESLPEGTLEELLLPENQEQLVGLLNYHVVGDELPSSNLKDPESDAISSVESEDDTVTIEVTTLEGSNVTIEAPEEKDLRIADANVISADIEASNGVIHVIDTVLMPEGLQEDMEDM